MEDSDGGLLMRICFLADAQSPHTEKWADYFCLRGDEVHIISFRSAELSGVRVHHLRPIGGKIGYLLLLHRVRKLVQEIRPDILHAHHATSYGLAGAVARYRPYVISTWGSDVMDFPNKSFLHKKLVKYNLRRSDMLTATSRILTAVTGTLASKSKRVDTIPFGVDLDEFRPIENGSEPEYDFGTIKSLRQKYGIEYLIKAASIVRQEFPNIKVMIAGEGEQRRDLDRLVRRLGLVKTVTFVGKIPHHSVPRYLSKTKVFVVPSILESESFGVAAVEASAMELPVVASRIGGLPEVVLDQKTGILVPPRDPLALASAISRLLKDPDLCRGMGKAGRRFVSEHYDWHENAARMRQLYESLVGSY